MTAQFRLLIRDLRQQHQLSQDELARALGISRQSIISLEQGEYMPSFPLLLGMIEFFNCALEELVEGVPQVQKIEQITERKGSEDTQMQMTQWDPFQAMDRMRNEMDEVVDRTIGRVDWPRALGTTAGAMNIHETDKDYTLEIQVPGFKEGDINLELSENTLTVSGDHKAEEKEEGKNTIRREWEHAAFNRSVRFAQPIIEDKVEAKLSDGTLTITAPKVEPVKPKIKRIEVKK